MRLRVVVAGAAVAAAGLGGGAPAASAHGERNPAIRTVVDSVGVDGVSVRAAPGVAQRLELTNRGPSAVEVLAPSGEPFLRVGPAGVEANVASPTWYATGNPDGVFRPGPGIGPREPVRWRRVTAGPHWAWFAHELHPADGSGEPTPAIEAAGRPARLVDWRIDLRRAGGGDGTVAGHLEYRPVRGSFVARLTTPVDVSPGVQVAALTARSPGLFLQTTGPAVEPLGADGRPWARVTRRRTVVDVASPTYREQLRGPAGPPAPAGTGRPRWRRVPTPGTLNWVEPRARYPTEEPPATILKRTEPSVVRRWDVGLRVGGRDIPVRGETTWVPVARSAVAPGDVGTGDGLGVGGTLGFGLVALAAGAGGLWLLRRRAGRAGAAG